MESDVSAIVVKLRAGLDVRDRTPRLTHLYEHWLSREAWSLKDEAVPLLLGVDPADWPPHGPGRASEAAAIEASLAADPHVRGSAEIAPVVLRSWARRHAVELPAALTDLLDFIVTAVQAPVALEPAPAAAAEREAVLGAALALVTKFPELCRDRNGFYDGAQIADLMLEKSAVWFPDGPPRMPRDDIANLIERYLV